MLRVAIGDHDHVEAEDMPSLARALVASGAVGDGSEFAPWVLVRDDAYVACHDDVLVLRAEEV